MDLDLRGQGQAANEKKEASSKFRIDRDIGHIELGVVDYRSLTIVSASKRFYGWINRPNMQRVSLPELIPGMDRETVHQALESFDGVCELEGYFLSAGGVTVHLRLRLIKTGTSIVSPLRLLAFDIAGLRKKEEALRSVSQMLESHQALMAESRKTLKVLLDSLPQAVFLVDSTLHITSEMSRTAEELFGKGMQYANLADLLGCTEEDLEPLRMAFSGVDWELMAGVLPSEFVRNDKVFSIGFIPVVEYEAISCVTVVITDITERRRMEKTLDQTDSDNRALVAILAAKDEFIDLVNIARKARVHVHDLSAFRSMVHGLKGGLSFLNCDKLVNMCHRAEEQLTPSNYTPEYGKAFIEELNAELWAFIKRYQQVLQIDSGSDTDVSSLQLQLDYQAIGTIFSRAEKECASPALLSAIEQLAELPAQKLLGWLDTAWLKTLAGESKEGMPISWSGDVTLAREPYKELFQSFIHIIFNAADHGIELPAEREQRGKARAGAMHIETSYKDGIYLITFEDDGVGMDPDAIVGIAHSRGFKVPKNITRQQALMLVCEPGFSSRTTVTALSGRGIGVDAVRRTAQMCGGDLRVESTLGVGTKISVWFKRQRYWP